MSKDYEPPAGSLQKPAKPLPPVEPPTAGFLVQLFLAPMLIVAIIVAVWMMFSYFAFTGEDPQRLIVGMERMNDATWQKASTLADLLRNPRYVEIKNDPELARRLAKVLDEQVESGGLKPNAIKLRMFLARALGEFRVIDGLPALVKAATVERDANEPRDPAKPWFPKEVDVRRAALEALAVLGSNVGPAKLRGNEELMAALTKAARERAKGEDPGNDRAHLRQTAAFTLGVIGGEKALDRLDLMLADAYPNVRYNAATGLARHGDTRAVPTLLEMLDPQNDAPARLALNKSGEQWNRTLVMVNGIRASEVLAKENRSADLSEIEQALQRLRDSDQAPVKVKSEAAAALARLQS